MPKIVVKQSWFFLLFDLKAFKVHKDLKPLNIILRRIHQASPQRIFRGLMHIVHAQFAEDVLSVSIHRMKTREAFLRDFLSCHA